ncbi:MAG: hypothetical protein KDJ54_20160 [Candidatus Competibacteraceae bacterium]|nr:hypothetical protein [Candidatus Competibacteraceae bacterium]
MTVYHQNDPIMAELRSLLVSPPVQKIQFRFGTFQLLSLDFRHLAQRLADPSSRVSILVDPSALKANVLAKYKPAINQFVFASDTVMRTPRGRGIVVHESVHAIFDLRDSISMDLAEESITFLAEAWYCVEIGAEADFLAHEAHRILDIAKAVRARGRSTIPEVTLSERIELRRIVRKRYDYSPGLSRRGGGFK